MLELFYDVKSKYLGSVEECIYLRYRTQLEVEIQYANSSKTYSHYI